MGLHCIWLKMRLTRSPEKWSTTKNCRSMEPPLRYLWRTWDDAAADLGGDAELFVELAGEGLLGGFAQFDLAAGELPLEAHGLVGAALADEDLGLLALAGGGMADDDGGDDEAQRLAAGVGVVVQSADAILQSRAVSPRVQLYNPSSLDDWKAISGPLDAGQVSPAAGGGLVLGRLERRGRA